MRSLLGTVIWVLEIFSLISLSMSYHSLLVWRVSIERSAVILTRILLWFICCFSLAAFHICSLCLIFVNLINICLGVFCLEFILFGTVWVSWTWITISFPILGKFSIIITSSIFSWSLFSSSSGTPIVWMLGCLTLFWRSLRLSSFLFILFLFFSSLLNSFLWFCLLPHLFYLLPPLFYYQFPPECFLSHLLHCSLYSDSFFFIFLGPC